MISRIGEYKTVYDFCDKAFVHHIVDDRAYGYVFHEKRKHPMAVSWSLDGKCTSGQAYNIILD